MTHIWVEDIYGMSTSKRKEMGVNDLDLIREEISELAAEIKELEEKLNLLARKYSSRKKLQIICE